MKLVSSLRACALALCLGSLPLLCRAHAFTQPYTLPVPFSLYALGAGIALVMSFVIVGLFVTAPSLSARKVPERASPIEQCSAFERVGPWVKLGRILSLALLLLCIATGLFGNRSPFVNFNMTFFWIVFVLGVPYATALVGDFYARINPWLVLVKLLQRAGAAHFESRFALPKCWGHVPALLLYMAFIWIELFGQLSPWGLAWALLGYTVINIVGAWALGIETWFRHGEFFGVFLRLIGRMAPWCPAGELDARGRPNPRGHWRAPFVGFLIEPVNDVGLVLFILFMLSSTAFDGLHQTLPFTAIFWKGIYPEIAPLFSPAPGQQYALSARLYYMWQWCVLALSPLLYLAVFAGFVALAKGAAGTIRRVTELTLRFSASLVPIAFVYHVTHYYTLLLAQGGQVVKLLSDPFGWGWNLFGTAKWSIEPLMVDVNAIWHTQVALILAGHIVSVYLAHSDALSCFATPRRAALSQLPLLVLMVMFTTAGLWILSLPLATGGG